MNLTDIGFYDNLTRWLKKGGKMSLQYNHYHYSLYRELGAYFFKTRHELGKRLFSRIEDLSKAITDKMFNQGIVESFGPENAASNENDCAKELRDFLDSWRRISAIVEYDAPASRLSAKLAGLDLDDPETIKSLIFSISKGIFIHRRL